MDSLAKSAKRRTHRQTDAQTDAQTSRCRLSPPSSSSRPGSPGCRGGANPPPTPIEMVLIQFWLTFGSMGSKLGTTATATATSREVSAVTGRDVQGMPLFSPVNILHMLLAEKHINPQRDLGHSTQTISSNIQFPTISFQVDLFHNQPLGTSQFTLSDLATAGLSYPATPSTDSYDTNDDVPELETPTP